MYFFNLLKSLQEALADLVEAQHFFRKVPYFLEEINTQTQQLVIRCRGSRTYIKTTIEDAIVAPNIIEGLPAIHACWIGYFHGKALREGRYKQSSTKTSLSLQAAKKRYVIVALEHRNLKITYLDVKTRTEYKKHVITLARDKEFLNNISSSQAFYIGVWAGIAVAKHGPDILNREPKLPSYLRIVK